MLKSTCYNFANLLLILPRNVTLKQCYIWCPLNLLNFSDAKKGDLSHLLILQKVSCQILLSAITNLKMLNFHPISTKTIGMMLEILALLNFYHESHHNDELINNVDKYDDKEESFVCCILDILNVMDLPVQVLMTDRHTGIKKLMRKDKRFQDNLHQFDEWHVGKSLFKKLMKASQKKGYKSFHISFSPKRTIQQFMENFVVELNNFKSKIHFS